MSRLGSVLCSAFCLLGVGSASATLIDRGNGLRRAVPPKAEAGPPKEAAIPRRSTTASLIQLIAVATFLAALPLERVEATPITFTFEGTITGLLETTPEYASFTTPTPFTLTAIADTANIVTALFTNGVYLFSLDTDSATMSIESIGSFEFALGTRVFVARGAVLNSLGPIDELGFGRAGLNGDPLIGFTNSAFATYDLATAFGPLFLGNTLLAGAIPTTLGTLGIANVADVTFTATTVAAVPEPATLALIGLGLVGLGYSRRRKA